MRFVYSHYFVSALRLSFGVVCVFVIGYFLTDSITSSVATIGAAYVSLIDRPAPILPRVKEMLAGALLGAIAVGVTGLALNHALALLLVMTVMAFFFFYVGGLWCQGCHHWSGLHDACHHYLAGRSYT